MDGFAERRRYRCLWCCVAPFRKELACAQDLGIEPYVLEKALSNLSGEDHKVLRNALALGRWKKGRAKLFCDDVDTTCPFCEEAEDTVDVVACD